MAALRLSGLVLICVALLMPSAAAAAGRGELESGSLVLSPAATVASAGLTAFFEGASALELALDGTDVSVQKVGVRDTTQGSLVGADSATVDERATSASARLTLVPQGPGDAIALRHAGLAMGTAGEATVRGVAGALLMALPGEGGDETPRCLDDQALPCIDVFGAYEIQGDALDVTLEPGDVYLMIYGPTLVVEDAQGRTEYTSGRRVAEQTGPVTQTEDAYLLVRATALGRLVGDGRLYSVAPTIQTPSVTFQDASGAVRVGARDYRASGDDVAAAGDITLAPGPVAPAPTHGDAGPQYAATITTRVSGEIQTIDLEGNLAFLDTPAEKAGAAAILLALVGGAAYAWQHVTFGAAALYTRLNKPDILENDVRNHIYEIIRLNPGISAREVHRRSNQSWGTVVYHLRQLERHHLVVSRALGRTRNYYENHGKYKGMEAQLACLQSDRARVLARAIAAQPGITQEQLAVAASLPQPTTSYYVRKLKQAGLVEEQRDGRYVKYVPHADLPRFIQLSESSVQSGAPAGAGVQA